MSLLKKLFDYQKFVENPLLEAQINAVKDKYGCHSEEIPDDFLDLSAAGAPEETHRFEKENSDDKLNK